MSQVFSNYCLRGNPAICGLLFPRFCLALAQLFAFPVLRKTTGKKRIRKKSTTDLKENPSMPCKTPSPVQISKRGEDQIGARKCYTEPNNFAFLTLPISSLERGKGPRAKNRCDIFGAKICSPPSLIRQLEFATNRSQKAVPKSRPKKLSASGPEIRKRAATG